MLLNFLNRPRRFGVKNAVGFLVFLYCVDGLVRKQWWNGHPKVFSKPGDLRMKRILDRMTTLKRRYMPPCWAHSSYLQFVVLLFWRFIHSHTADFKKHIIECEDGGEVAVEEFIHPTGQELAPQAPIVVILHTITGISQDEIEFCKHAHSAGFRPIVLSRRGHFDVLKAGSSQRKFFNVMGCTDDTTRKFWYFCSFFPTSLVFFYLGMVKYVRNLYPDSEFVGAAGVSAGSGQVCTFIGKQDEELVEAAVSLCPAYDIKEAFTYFQETSPLLAAYLLSGLKSFFLHKNEHVLSTAQPEKYQQALQAKSMQEFVEKSVTFAGFPCFESYLEDSNPMKHFHKNTVPCLILNALDDPLCVEKNIRFDIASETENFALAITNCGSHVAYREGILGQSSYMHHVAIDFLQSAYSEKKAKKC